LPESKANRTYAQSIAATIQMDILSGNYDATQNKYKLFQPEMKAEAISNVELLDLWDRYVEYKRPQVSLNTIAHTYHQVTSWLKKMPYTSVDDAIKIRGYLLKYSTPDSTRRVLNGLSACCQWSIKSKLLDRNPFEGLGAGLTKKVKKEIEYFTETERSQIIEYFKTYDPDYSALVEFMFRVGCRPSEALALEWRDISDGCDTIVFSRALTSNEYGSKVSVKDGLKTQATRTVPCGKTLIAFLLSIVPEDKEAQDLIFPAPNGGYIDISNFATRHWTPMLKQIKLKHRSFYKVRHTAITHALDTLDAKDVAALVGNSATVIYRNYAGVKENLKIPDF
jgi:integrase